MITFRDFLESCISHDNLVTVKMMGGSDGAWVSGKPCYLEDVLKDDYLDLEVAGCNATGEKRVDVYLNMED